ncbi:protein of unknown function (DUF4500) [Popillia japonica]|uniref:Small integral membrane protein 8 n=1 Tax=Popillia japonica TaxID=7064 RepID=A0AAW1M4R1_POPJA
MDKKPETVAESSPGDGIRSLKTSRAFRIVNFELYTKPNAVIMGIGLIGLAGSLIYITYMRHKYESLGYYSAIQFKKMEKNNF